MLNLLLAATLQYDNSCGNGKCNPEACFGIVHGPSRLQNISEPQLGPTPVPHKLGDNLISA